MPYLVLKKIQSLAGGGIRRQVGQYIADGELPPATIQQMIDEGVVQPDTPTQEKETVDELTKIRGVTRAIAHGLRALGFSTVEAMANADPLAFEAIQGVNAKTAKEISDAARAQAGKTDKPPVRGAKRDKAVSG